MRRRFARVSTLRGHYRVINLTIYKPISHRLPENPGGQLQLNSLIRSVQVPLFKQGLLSHSFISERKKETNKQTTAKNKTKTILRKGICNTLTSA